MVNKLIFATLLGSALMTTPVLAQTASSTGQWQGSKLIHMNVYNDRNEKIGDIKELMVDKSGKIESVVIGVGGFLGMGTHDVAVKFGELKWEDNPVRTSSSTNENSANTNRPAGTTGASTGTSSNRSDTTRRNYPDHAVLNASKDQLQAMPEFDYSK